MAFFILGIESSCDETSAAVVRLNTDSIGTSNDNSLPSLSLLSDVTARQEEVHERFGGVVPELASRRHLETLLPVVKSALAKANMGYEKIDAIAVTNRPGLIGSLMVGVNAAKTLAFTFDLPLIPINHLESHLAAVLLAQPKLRFPCLGLIISGGHTSLYEISEGWKEFKPLGHTRDDAAGEAFDKSARLMGLPYPGGPEVARLATKGNPKAIPFPRALPQKSSLEFSFSGLKTAVSTFLRDNPTYDKADLCASVQEAIVDSLVQKTISAVRSGHYQDLIVAGGVAANQRLREKLLAALPTGVDLHIPPPALCTDNGAMIATLGALHFYQGQGVRGSAANGMEVSPRTEAKDARGKFR